MRCSDINGNDLRLFDENIEPQDIKQGTLGDCYYMCALAALAERPDRIKKLFVVHERNPEQCTSIILCKNGVKQLVIVDEFVPCKNGYPTYSRAKGQETWVLMLEKAWAKIHGSYERIVSGNCQNAIRDLTGAPG